MSASGPVDVFDVGGVDELFSGDLADFVKRRDELAKQLRKDGEKEAAAAVKALTKPSRAAWAVNQVARTSSTEIDELIRAGQAVRDAQADAVRGKDVGSLRTSQTKWRDIVRALAGKAAATAGEQYRDDAAATFEAASTDEQLAALLKAGRLTAGLSPSGFGLAGMPEPPDRPARERREPTHESVDVEPPPRDDRAIEIARKQLEEREEALTKAVHRLRRAEQRLEVAQQAVDEAAVAVDDKQSARDEADAALRAAEK
jgi:hypothetical protein